jgi:hypothetical protein
MSQAMDLTLWVDSGISTNLWEALSVVRGLPLESSPDQLVSAVNNLALTALLAGVAEMRSGERTAFLKNLKDTIAKVPLPPPPPPALRYQKREKQTYGVIAISQEGVETEFINIMSLNTDEREKRGLEKLSRTRLYTKWRYQHKTHWAQDTALLWQDWLDKNTIVPLEGPMRGYRLYKLDAVLTILNTQRSAVRKNSRHKNSRQRILLVNGVVELTVDDTKDDWIAPSLIGSGTYKEHKLHASLQKRNPPKNVIIRYLASLWGEQTYESWLVKNRHSQNLQSADISGKYRVFRASAVVALSEFLFTPEKTKFSDQGLVLKKVKTHRALKTAFGSSVLSASGISPTNTYAIAWDSLTPNIQSTDEQWGFLDQITPEQRTLLAPNLSASSFRQKVDKAFKFFRSTSSNNDTYSQYIRKAYSGETSGQLKVIICINRIAEIFQLYTDRPNKRTLRSAKPLRTPKPQRTLNSARLPGKRALKIARKSIPNIHTVEWQEYLYIGVGQWNRVLTSLSSRFPLWVIENRLQAACKNDLELASRISRQITISLLGLEEQITVWDIWALWKIIDLNEVKIPPKTLPTSTSAVISNTSQEVGSRLRRLPKALPVNDTTASLEVGSNGYAKDRAGREWRAVRIFPLQRNEQSVTRYRPVRGLDFTVEFFKKYLLENPQIQGEAYFGGGHSGINPSEIFALYPPLVIAAISDAYDTSPLTLDESIVRESIKESSISLDSLKKCQIGQSLWIGIPDWQDRDTQRHALIDMSYTYTDICMAIAEAGDGWLARNCIMHAGTSESVVGGIAYISIYNARALERITFLYLARKKREAREELWE